MQKDEEVKLFEQLAQEEKEWAFFQLLNTLKDYPEIQPPIEQMIKDHKNKIPFYTAKVKMKGKIMNNCDMCGSKIEDGKCLC